MSSLKAAAIISIAVLTAQADNQGCSFQADPAQFLNTQARAMQRVHESLQKVGSARASAAQSTVAAADVERRNFIDDAILPKLDALRVRAAKQASDEEMVRRIFLDLTGRIPSAWEVRSYVSDGSRVKREQLIERLLYMPEFADKWAVWFADLIQNTEGLSTSNRRPQIEGRNALDAWLRQSIRNGKPIRDMVTELIVAKGNNYQPENGPANYPVLASTAMGPAQDTYDMMFSRTAGQFLGIAHYDCLLCHSGPRHLTGISVFGDRTTRGDAQRMAAHFARMRLPSGAPTGAKQYEHVLYNSTDVQDNPTGNYDLNTTYGNRPNRMAIGTTRSFTPEYRDGAKPAAGQNWREFFAQKLTSDPMFARNFANRLWKEFFGLGLVDPVDTLDPARLDPSNPPPAPWTLQATHPELLEELAKFFVDNNTDLRAFVRLLATSAVYGFSSSYDADWKLDYVPLFARHYPRRLTAEEVHDALATGTGVPGKYTWPLVNGSTVAQGSPLPQSEPVGFAMQLPDVNEPRGNTAVRDFMRSFYRGNRDTAQRMQAGSILQQLNLMNSTIILDRIRVANSPVMQTISRMTDLEAMAEEIFLTFLSRRPTTVEREKAVAHLSRPGARNDAIQDLAWACVNKLDFLFSY